MSELLANLATAFAAISIWEFFAVLFGVVYLLLAIQEHIWCWYAAFVSTAISIYIFWNVQLIMESALQIYYLAMAIYGWYHWKYGNVNNGDITIACWRLRVHLLVIIAVLLISLVSGYLLANNTAAAWPYLDSFTTWASVLTTWMVARKILENWIYWLVIDSVSIFLYLDRGLYLYAMLFMAYLIIVIFGFVQWKQSYQKQAPCPI